MSTTGIFSQRAPTLPPLEQQEETKERSQKRKLRERRQSRRQSRRTKAPESDVQIDLTVVSGFVHVTINVPTPEDLSTHPVVEEFTASKKRSARKPGSSNTSSPSTPVLPVVADLSALNINAHPFEPPVTPAAAPAGSEKNPEKNSDSDDAFLSAGRPRSISADAVGKYVPPIVAARGRSNSAMTAAEAEKPPPTQRWVPPSLRKRQEEERLAAEKAAEEAIDKAVEDGSPKKAANKPTELKIKTSEKVAGKKAGRSNGSWVKKPNADSSATEGATENGKESPKSILDRARGDSTESVLSDGSDLMSEVGGALTVVAETETQLLDTKQIRIRRVDRKFDRMFRSRPRASSW